MRQAAAIWQPGNRDPLGQYQVGTGASLEEGVAREENEDASVDIRSPYASPCLPFVSRC